MNNLNDTISRVQALLTLKEGWNGYDALPPDPDAIQHAAKWIRGLYLEVSNIDHAWIEPNVIADAEGNVVFEWWHGKKKLTVYVGRESAEYVQVWGTDIYSEMAEGDVESASIQQKLWLWLVS
ncbi:MAG TPA: hypothetical protein VFA41_11765 [Ktedonobacteraceae bacterium]|jgi:hypothetical protein|nr:hypothetical protein [Ktedonobacteraceae bacterium]